jgi:hypothetical protein
MTIHAREEFETVAETEVDSRGRVSLGRAGARTGRRYRVQANPDGVLLLTPVVSIPERELQVWTDPELAQRIRTGIEHAHAGKTHDLGDFSKYLAGEDED